MTTKARQRIITDFKDYKKNSPPGIFILPTKSIMKFRACIYGYILINLFFLLKIDQMKQFGKMEHLNYQLNLQKNIQKNHQL